MSSRLAERLWRRARLFYEEAGEARDPDLAAFFAEQAIQLALKATLLRLFEEQHRGHGVRELLSILARRLEESGYDTEAEAVREFAAQHRGILIEAEEAYIHSRYGEEEYTREDAERLIMLAGEVLELLERVESRVKLG